MPDPVSNTGQARSGIQANSGFPLSRETSCHVGCHVSMKIFDSIESPFYKGRFRGIFKGNKKSPRPPLEKGVSKSIFIGMTALTYIVIA